MMRILRLYAPSLIGDHTLCYVSTNREGNVCINDVETPVLWARAGEPLDGEERAAAMTVVLPPDAKLNEGDFLSVGKYGATLLRWSDGGAAATEGPYAEAGEHLAGFFLLDVATPERAREVAERFAGPGDTVELRPAYVWPS